jgi:hypothetical protein
MAAKADLKTTISADMTGFSATMRRAGGLATTTGAKIGKSLGGATKAMGGLALSAGRVAASLAAAGTAAAGAGFVAGIKNAADLGGTLADLSARTGIAAGDLAKLGRAFEDNGVSADKIGGVINKLQKTITDFGNGSKTATKPFETLGIKFEDIAKLDPAAQFELIQSKIAAIQSPAERAAVAMQLFGKSGGELLTLFADGQAFANAGAFLGTQAEILNRSSGVFDSISDKMARIPAKLQGFFVGFLEPIAGDVDAVLTKFDNFDFAALGLRIGSAFNMENVISMISASVPLLVAVLADAFAKALDVFGALLQALFSAEGLSFMKNILIDVLVAGVDALGGAFYELAKNFGKALKGEVDMVDTTRIIGEAKPEEKAAPDFASRLQDELAEIDWAPSTAVTAAAGKFAEAFGKAFPKVPGQQTPQGDIYDKEAEEQGKRVAADAAREAYNVPQIDGTTYGPPDPRFQQFGPPQSAMSSRNGRLFGERGAPLGTDNVFARDRARLGIASGVSTGGLGEKRRLNTSANDKEAKKNLSLQEQQAASLQSIESNIKSAVTVN